jgi:hypothetical protein
MVYDAEGAEEVEKESQGQLYANPGACNLMRICIMNVTDIASRC